MTTSIFKYMTIFWYQLFVQNLFSRVKGLKRDKDKRIGQLASTDGSVHSIIICMFDFRGAHATLV